MSEFKDSYAHKVYQIPGGKAQCRLWDAPWTIAVVTPFENKRIVLNAKACLQPVSILGKWKQGTTEECRLIHIEDSLLDP